MLFTDHVIAFTAHQTRVERLTPNPAARPAEPAPTRDQTDGDSGRRLPSLRLGRAH